MKKASRILNKVLDILEVYLPAALFLVMFITFLIGIVYRYLLRDPQSWTYELQSICFLSVCMLSCGLVHRSEGHIVFDMAYEKYSLRTKCLMRILSNVLTALILIPLIPASVRYLTDMAGLSTQIMKIPRFLVFVSFPVMFVTALLRCGRRAVLDIAAFRDKTYVERYLPEREVTAE